MSCSSLHLSVCLTPGYLFELSVCLLIQTDRQKRSQSDYFGCFWPEHVTEKGSFVFYLTRFNFLSSPFYFFSFSFSLGTLKLCISISFPVFYFEVLPVRLWVRCRLSSSLRLFLSFWLCCFSFSSSSSLVQEERVEATRRPTESRWPLYYYFLLIIVILLLLLLLIFNMSKTLWT